MRLLSEPIMIENTAGLNESQIFLSLVDWLLGGKSFNGSSEFQVKNHVN